MRGMEGRLRKAGSHDHLAFVRRRRTERAAIIFLASQFCHASLIAAGGTAS
jgi:hypothetical protein